MKDTALNRYVSDLPAWAKGVLGVGVLAIVGFATYRAYQAYKTKQDLKDALQASVQAGNDLKALVAQGINPSYDASEYETFSTTLAQSMDGCFTKQSQINDVFGKMKNQADVLRLIQQFGVRYASPCVVSSPIDYLISNFWNDKAYGGNLNDWIGRYNQASNVNAILSKNNVNYQF